MLKKRIPTFLGIVLLLIGITAGVYLVELGPQPLTTRAVPEKEPLPTPTVTLQEPTTPPQESPAITSESQFSLESFPSVDQKSEVTIFSPGEGEAINTQTPEFFGQGPPGADLEITLESEHVTQAQLTVDEDGNWSWAANTNLEPGEHFITIRWLDDNGILRSIRRRFVVYAQGESSVPAFEATPSATGTPTPTPTPTPAELAAISPTPTLTPTPTPTPTLAPASPSAQATEPALPEPGTAGLSLGLFIAGVSMLVAGSLIFTRKRILN